MSQAARQVTIGDSSDEEGEKENRSTVVQDNDKFSPPTTVAAPAKIKPTFFQPPPPSRVRTPSPDGLRRSRRANIKPTIIEFSDDEEETEDGQRLSREERIAIRDKRIAESAARRQSAKTERERLAKIEQDEKLSYEAECAEVVALGMMKGKLPLLPLEDDRLVTGINYMLEIEYYFTKAEFDAIQPYARRCKANELERFFVWSKLCNGPNDLAVDLPDFIDFHHKRVLYDQVVRRRREKLEGKDNKEVKAKPSGNKVVRRKRRNDDTIDRPHKCAMCQSVYTTARGLQFHMDMHNGVTYDCEVCGHKCTQASHLVEHRRVHTGEKPYACPVCQKTFSRSSSMHLHERNVHK